jgi:hypothetical protein
VPPNPTHGCASHPHILPSIEIFRAQDPGKRVSAVVANIGGKPQLAAMLQDTRNRIKLSS